MIETKYDIGQTIYLPWKVISITITETDILYRLSQVLEVDKPYCTGNVIEQYENQMADADCVPVENYEAEIDDLKDEITRLREMYQLEHMKVLKAKFKAPAGITGDSHHPQENIYSDEWRRLP